MRLSFARKVRSSKAATLTASTSWAARWSAYFQNVENVLRLVLLGAFVPVMVVVLEAWAPPFPFQLGELVTDGIVARIDFEHTNLKKSELELIKRLAELPRYFRHHAQHLRELEDNLARDLLAVSQVHDISELDSSVRKSFGLQLDGTEPQHYPDSLLAEWQALRIAVGSPDEAPARINTIINEFTNFLTPIRESGVLDPQDLSRHDIARDDKIAVNPTDSPFVPSDSQIHVAEELLLSRMLEPGGRLAVRWSQFPTLSAIQVSLERWLLYHVQPTLVYDEESTAAASIQARAESPQIRDRYKRGQLLAAPGSRLDEQTLDILLAQHHALLASMTWSDRCWHVLMTVLLLVALCGFHGFYLVSNEPVILKDLTKITIYLIAVAIAVGIGRQIHQNGWRAETVPLLSITMIIAIAYNQVLAAMTGFSVTLLQALSTGGSLSEFVLLMSAITAAVIPLNRVASRSKLVIVGATTSVTYFVACWALDLVQQYNLNGWWWDQSRVRESLLGAGWCLAAGFLVAGGLPFVEKLLGVVTDISLLELSDVSHPLLQELVRRAPGTYSHSVNVAMLAEPAADAIGANGLLCRVGAYFHDIGKMLKPQYFVENMEPGQHSRHEHLNPAMSTLVIIGHVKDGVDLARQYNLPQPLIDFIEQHHGTTLVEYFYHAATRQAESQPEELRGPVLESLFRYPGPKPQTREAAVMMLADAAESATRALGSEITPKRIESLVHELAMKRLLDGQFDECPLTLRELQLVEETLVKSLIGQYHGRIRYPERKSA